MHPTITEIETRHRKPAIAAVRSGDTVRVHQLIREGAKQRVQVFEGVVIRTDRMDSVTASITVRRIASGIGVEKTFLMHSPNIDRVEVMRRGKVRRNYLTFLRDRRGKSARLKEVALDRDEVNVTPVKDVVMEDPIADADDNVDADITEIDPGSGEDELNQADESTEDVAKTESKEAAADDANAEDGGGDESVAEVEEAEIGVDKADKAV